MCSEVYVKPTSASASEGPATVTGSFCSPLRFIRAVLRSHLCNRTPEETSSPNPRRNRLRRKHTAELSTTKPAGCGRVKQRRVGSIPLAVRYLVLVAIQIEPVCFSISIQTIFDLLCVPAHEIEDSVHAIEISTCLDR